MVNLTRPIECLSCFALPCRRRRHEWMNESLHTKGDRSSDRQACWRGDESTPWRVGRGGTVNVCAGGRRRPELRGNANHLRGRGELAAFCDFFSNSTHSTGRLQCRCCVGPGEMFWTRVCFVSRWRTLSSISRCRPSTKIYTWYCCRIRI